MTYNPFSLKDKTILVTGASSGIGRAIATECSKMGARLIITGRNEERLQETFQNLEGNEHLKISGNLEDESFITHLSQTIPVINGIVHSAGISKRIPFKFTTKEKLDDIFRINFEAPSFLTLCLIKNKKIEKQGSIIFISSISGVIISGMGGTLYSATKGAINGLAKGLAIELAHQKIRVNTILPAMIETKLIHEGAITQEQMDEDASKYPLKRYGKPEEIAYGAIYLLSDASLWVTGSNLLIDGGSTLI